MPKAVICIARTEAQVGQVMGLLEAAGFSSHDISLLLPDATAMAATSADTSATLEGSLGWLAGIGSFAIPGLGPFIAAGPITTPLRRTAGSAVNRLTATLIRLGIPVFEARRYEGKLRQGNILISAHTDDALQRLRAKEIFERAGMEDIAMSVEEQVPGRRLHPLL